MNLFFNKQDVAQSILSLMRVGDFDNIEDLFPELK